MGFWAWLTQTYLTRIRNFSVDVSFWMFFLGGVFSVASFITWIMATLEWGYKLSWVMLPISLASFLIANYGWYRGRVISVRAET